MVMASAQRLKQMAGSQGRLLALLAVFALYVSLYRYSNFFHTTDLRATPWNPETGVAVVAGVLLGPRAIPLVIAANFTGNLLWGAGLGMGWSFVSSILHGLIFAGLASWFAASLVKLRSASVSMALQLILLAVAMTAISAVSRLVIAHLALQVSSAYLLRYTLAISIGNLIGILTIVPLALALAEKSSVRKFLGEMAWVDFLAFASIILLCFIVFGSDTFDEFRFFYLLFIPVIALSLRLGLAGAAAGILLLDFSMVAILRWLSFEPSTGLELQLLMISLSATGLLLGAAISERERMATELSASHERLQDSQAALQHASRLSLASEMAAALAHELNQPLAAIRNYVRTVRRKLDKPKLRRNELVRHIDDAVGQVDHAAALLRDARKSISRDDAGRGPINVDLLLQSSLDLVRQELASARVKVTLQVAPGLPGIVGNRGQLQLVLINLIRNAKEALVSGTRSGRHIRIEASTQPPGGHVRFAVSDNGPGIPENVRPLLFSPLRSSKPGGLGLGLSLCRSIIGSHGGEIWLEDVSASGTTMLFTVPAERAGAVQP